MNGNNTKLEQRVPSGDRAWVELDSRALAANLKYFRRVLDQAGNQKTRLGFVLKGNAYGHGLPAIVAMLCCLEEFGQLDVVYVISLDEARVVSGRAPETLRIVILGAHPCPLWQVPDAMRFEWVLSSFSQLQALEKGGAAPNLSLKVHFHVDTGLGREGFLPEELPLAAQKVGRISALEVVGCMTHFANTEDVTRQEYALEQIECFDRAFEILGASNPALVGLERHLAATAATFVLPSSHRDVVRIGIGLYGFWPSSETRLSHTLNKFSNSTKKTEAEDPLKPVLSWRVSSQCIKKLDSGSFVGYGCSFRCERETTVAVFPVGYFDGYVRHLSSHSYVLVRGQRCPVIGRVMMNHIVVDVTNCGLNLCVPEGAPGDTATATPTVTATLIGRDGQELITAEDLAVWSGTIHYEVVTRISSSLERVIIDADKGFSLRPA